MGERIKRDCQCKRARHQHGTRTAYTVDKCRCPDCTRAAADHAKQVNRQKAYGRYDSGRVDAGPVRDHVRYLMDNGISYKQVAALSGVSLSAVGALLYGRPERGHAPYPRVARTTADKILAIKPSLEAMADGHVVDGIGTRRRLQALVAIGWSQASLASRLGVLRGNFGHLMYGRNVTAATARKVKALYDELWDQPQTGTEWHAKTAATRARNIAARNGWLPPMAWDDDTIDDPAVTPSAPEDDTTKAEARLADVEFLVRTGTPLAELVTRSGFRTLIALERHCYRYGRGDLVAAIKNTGERTAA